MGLLIDLHVHTRRYSACSQIDPEHLISQAVKKGLDGLVITEHRRQWTDQELADLIARSRDPGFLLLAGFEYESSQGDILVYGLRHDQVDLFAPGLPPEKAAAHAIALGGVCIACHPTRAGMSFDERLMTIPFAAFEVASVNLKEHEQRLAMMLAKGAKRPIMAASDAHQLREVGSYVTEFDDPIRNMADLHDALQHARFHVPIHAKKGR